MIGILAYGSLIADPGWEIQDAIAWTVPDVMTPFAVEYARCSRTRAGAPTLVPVSSEVGIPVQAKILVLKKEVRETTALNILYRREIHRVGDTKKRYVPAANPSPNQIIIRRLENYYQVKTVFYTQIAPNREQILSGEISEEEKASLLAAWCAESLTHDTYFTCGDGIHYLSTAIHFGVRTRLTESYRQAVLRLAGGPSRLEEARLKIAREKGII
jgi:hypothetical protein